MTYKFETFTEYLAKMRELERDKRRLHIVGYCYGEGRGGYRIEVI